MKNIVIIGASSGIGKATAALLSVEGYNVYGTYNSGEIAGDIQGQQLDVTDGVIDSSTLPDQIDGLIYCPGSINLKPFNRIKPESFAEDFNLQVLGAIKTIQTLLPNLKKSEQASIVLFSTVAVQSGFNFHSQVSVSKGAIEGLTKALAAEFAPQMRVNAIAPSLTHTPLASKLLSTDEKIEANGKRHPLQRIGTAEDIAEMARFLISDKSSWITGQIMHVDGGMSTLKA